jgi:hypothetical protein
MTIIPTRLVLKHTGIAASTPSTSYLELGELALNYTDGKIFYKGFEEGVPVIKSLSTGGGGGGVTDIITGISISENGGLSITTSGGSEFTTAGNFVFSDPINIEGGERITNVIKITTDDYNSLVEVDPNITYIILP